MPRPRGEGKHKTDYKIKDAYEDFKYKERVPYHLYRLIIEAYWKKVIHAIIEDCEVFEMPLRFGALRVRKKKMNLSALTKYNRLKIDFKKFNETGKKVYHLNEHRKGYRYNIVWDKRKAGKIVHKGWYKYVPTRAMNRRMSQILKTDFSKDYYE